MDVLLFSCVGWDPILNGRNGWVRWKCGDKYVEYPKNEKIKMCQQFSHADLDYVARRQHADRQRDRQSRNCARRGWIMDLYAC
jgi:hypothetical protein